jgi:hypothetical protein
MTWKNKLERLEKDVVEKREVVAEQDKITRASLEKESQRAFDELGIIDVLQSIRDDIWGAGEIRHEVTSYGFEAELYYEYPEYFPESWISSNSDFGTDTRIPPTIDFKRESLKLELHVTWNPPALYASFIYADYDLLLQRRGDFIRKYGSEYGNRFWSFHDSDTQICSFKIGQDLTSCKEYLEKALLDYCAVKSLLPREELLEIKSKKVIKALKGELPVEHVNQRAVSVLRELGLLNNE